MNILAWILLGSAVGAVASFTAKSSKNFIGNIIVGAVGAFLGGWLALFFGEQPIMEFSWYSILVALLGSIILLWVVHMAGRGRETAP